MPARTTLLAALLCLLPFSPVFAAEGKTVWDGVYTAAQAARGADAYAAECSRCHKEDLSGYRNLLIGERFMDDWREDRLESFFSLVKKTMPRNAPASLSDRDYLDIVAFVLQTNSFPEGARELTAGDLAGIRIEARQGAQTVPNYALVEVVGCLVQSSNGDWAVTEATEPVRTRNPENSPAAELEALKEKPAGAHSFRLLDATVIQVGPPGTPLPHDRKVDAKGFLMRKPGEDTINLTSLQPLGTACTHDPK
jgi:mono/diheme cytochrome c family protein